MGLTVLELEVANPATPKATEKIEFPIDAGAVYSVVPATVLQRLGIEPLAEETFRLANGEKTVRRKGVAVSDTPTGSAAPTSDSEKRAPARCLAP